MEQDDLKAMYSAIGRYRASKRRLVERRCAVCGKPTIGLKRRMYCSKNCNCKAYRLRKQQTKRAKSDG